MPALRARGVCVPMDSVIIIIQKMTFFLQSVDICAHHVRCFVCGFHYARRKICINGEVLC